jgi:ADP-heptose:LPS heptosyltransferase
VKPRILIIFPGALGDLICLGPALRALAARHAGADLELMARAELAQFAVGRMAVARGHSIDRPEVSLLFHAAPDAPARARPFFAPFAAIHSFFGSNNRQYREALAAAGSGQVFFHSFRPSESAHVSASYLHAVDPHARLSSRYRLELTDQDLNCAAAVIKRLGIAERPILLLPGSGSPSKNWPVRSFVELGRTLGRQRVIVVVGPAESGIVHQLADLVQLQHPSLGCLAGLARLSQGFIGNDSGVSHLAAAAGARGVVIFGPTDPDRWRPCGEVRVCRRMPLEALHWSEVARNFDQMGGHAESVG